MTVTTTKGRPPKDPDSKKVKLTISFNPLLLVSLNEHAAKYKRPRTEIVEQAVKEYLTRNKAKD
jgi:metal-responsive CopG/Arc/MetJ family transcriptional regulator